MSTISKILGSYKNALDDSQQRYKNLCTERIDNAKTFNDAFFTNWCGDIAQDI